MTAAKPVQVIAEGRPVMHAHPSLSLDAAGLLHTLDELSHEDRLKARAYLLHVYGLTVGITDPATRALPEWDAAMRDVAEAAWLARLEGDERPLDEVLRDPAACVCDAEEACLGIRGESDACGPCLALHPAERCLAAQTLGAAQHEGHDLARFGA